MNRRPLLVVLATGVVCVVLALVAWLWWYPQAEAPAVAEEPMPIGGPFTLVDQDGREVTEADFAGRYMLIYFGYTFCPDICPTSLQTMSTALSMLDDEERAKVAFLFITVDPKRDSVRQMADYVALFDPAPIGLTGTKEQTDAAAKAYRMYYRVPESDTEDYFVDHSSFVYLMDEEGRYVTHFAHDATAEEMAAKLGEVLG